MADRDRTSGRGGRRDVRDADESEDFSSGRQTVIPPSTGPRSKPGQEPADQPKPQDTNEPEPPPPGGGEPTGPGR